MWWELGVRVSVIQCHLKSQAIQVQQVNKHWPLKLSQHSGKLWLSSPSTSLDPAVYTDCNSRMENLKSSSHLIILSSRCPTHHHIPWREKQKNNGNSISAFKDPNQSSCNKPTLGQFSLHALADSHMKYFEANTTLKSQTTLARMSSTLLYFSNATDFY